MRVTKAVGAVVLVVLFGVRTAFAADCVALLQPVSQLGVFPNRAAGPIAWSGTEYGIAKAESSQLRPLWFGRLDSELTSVAPDTQVAVSTRDGALALFWSGSEYTVFYETREPRLMMQRISPAGALIGAPIAVASPLGLWSDREFDIIWDAARGAYAIAYTIPQGGSRGLWLTIVEPNGTVRFDTLVNPFVADPILPQIASTSAGLVMLFHQSVTGLMHSTLYGPDGTFSQAFSVAVPGANGQLEWNGTTLLYLTSAPVSGGSEIHWTRLDARGNLVFPEARFFQASGRDAAPVHLVWNPEDREWAVAYRDSYLGFQELPGEYRLARFTADGELLSDTFFSPQDVFSTFQAAYPFIWTGSAYVSAISRLVSVASGTHSYAVRNCPVRAAVMIARPVVSLNELVTFSVALTGGVGPFTYEWDLNDTTIGNVFGSPVTHRYRTPGRYTVTVTVTDSLGARAVATTTVNVVIPKRRAVAK